PATIGGARTFLSAAISEWHRASKCPEVSRSTRVAADKNVRGPAAILLAVALLAGRCSGAIPDNDSFATRITLYGTNVSTTGSNVGAIQELGEPDPNFSGGKSVW